MVAGLTAGREKFKDVEAEMRAVLETVSGLRRELTSLVDRDTDAFDAVMTAMRLPRETDEEKETRRRAVEKANQEAAAVPLRVTELSCEVLALSRVVAEKGNPNAITDAGVAAGLALAGAEGAGLNVLINLGGIKDDAFRSETGARVRRSLDLARKTAAEAAEVVRRRMG